MAAGDSINFGGPDRVSIHRSLAIEHIITAAQDFVGIARLSSDTDPEPAVVWEAVRVAVRDWMATHLYFAF